MKKTVSQQERTRQLLEEPVDKLIISLAGPSVASMLITSIYNMADTYFVSQLGTSASGAVGVTFSIMTLIQAFAFMIGQGSGNNMSRELGAGRREEAKVYVAICFFTELIVGTLLAVLALLFMDRLVFWLGATETIAPYAKDYARWIVVGFPFIMASFGLNNILRFQGNASLGAIGMMTGGILNMVLDPVLIFGFGLGTAGAAIATTLSQMISFGILTWLCNHKAQSIKIEFRNFKPTLALYGKVAHIGLPSLARQGIMSLSNIVFNHAAGPYGDACIAAFSIVNRYMGLLCSAVIGIGQGFQPVCGQNIGAGNKKRVREAYFFLLKSTFVVLAALAVISFIFAPGIIRLFRKDDVDVILIGTRLLRFEAVTLPTFAMLNSANMFSQTMGFGVKASMIAALKSGFCLIPLVLTLPAFFGMNGLIYAQPLSDVISASIGFLMIRPVLARLKTETV